MLDLQKSRLDYGELLKPPTGFDLDFAIGTTYSLDLRALLSIPVALFYAKNLDGAASAQRLDIFAAIQKTAQHLKIYCQKGKIADSNHNLLIGFIENCVTEILPKESSTSFHSKIWILRFKNEEQILYRTIVLSRNLTFDRSLDISYMTEGFVSSKTQKRNKPLVDFATYLNDQDSFNNSKQFIKELSYVDFHEAFPFDQQFFHPMGLNGYKNPFLENKGFEDLLIISPFLSKAALERFSDQKMTKRSLYLFSREEELAQIDARVLTPYNCYALSSLVVEGEGNIDTGTTEEEQVSSLGKTCNLHAKIYIGEKEGRTHCYLGSANCSSAALRENQEFLVELQGDDNKISIKKILDDLLGPNKEKGIFRKYEPAAKEKNIVTVTDFRKASNNFLKFVEDGNLGIELLPTEDKKYIIQVSRKIPFDQVLTDCIIEIAPFGWKGEMKNLSLEQTCKFQGISLHNLNKFLRIRISIGKDQETFLIKTNLVIPEIRMDAILTSVISNKENFFRLLQFLLGNTSVESFINQSDDKKSGEGRATQFFTDSPILEKFMKAASRDKNALRDVETLIAKLPKAKDTEIIPSDFLEFWSVFKKRIK